MEVCKLWRVGRCNRRPCPYLHAELPRSWRATRTTTKKTAAPSIRPTAWIPASKNLKENRAPPSNPVLPNKNMVNYNVTGGPPLPPPKTMASVRRNGGGSTRKPGANSIHYDVAEESAPAAKIQPRLPMKRAGARDEANGRAAAAARGCLRNDQRMNTNISRCSQSKIIHYDDAEESAPAAATIGSRLPKKRARASDEVVDSISCTQSKTIHYDIAKESDPAAATIESRLPKKRAKASNEEVFDSISCSQSKTIHNDVTKESAPAAATVESRLTKKRGRASDDEVVDRPDAAAAEGEYLRNNNVWINPNISSSQSKRLKKQESSCVNDDPPEYSTTSKCFSLLADLRGHKKEIVGMVVPPNSNKLYTASRDGLVRIWDCETAQCILEENIGCEINLMFNKGEQWLFIATNNFVQAWNSESGSSFRLNVPAGQQVLVVETHDKMLFAGMQDGSILVWKPTVGDESSKNLEPIAILPGHDGKVVSMVVGKMHLYSGSTDNTIRQWDLKTLECTNILKGHNSVVTSLLCWNEHIISSSLDQTIKVWCFTENGFESIYSHREEHAALELCEMQNEEGKSILICSYSNNSVHLYDLPSFNIKGKILANERISSIHKVPGPYGIFFTGAEHGVLKVWNLCKKD